MTVVFFDVIDANILSSDDHKHLYSQLESHAAKWKEIGTYLGFSQFELDIIQNSPVHFMKAPKSWLSAMLKDWLQWKTGDQRGSPTLENLKTAVDKVGLGRAAEELHL